MRKQTKLVAVLSVGKKMTLESGTIMIVMTKW